MYSRRYQVALAMAASAAMLLIPGSYQSSAQEQHTRGQTVAPVYEGWVEHADGTFSLVFGYLNRNYGEVLDIPIGPDNDISPGGPDQGQPTHFLTRRRRYQFHIKVPRDFGDQELVWTLTSRGETERAYGTLKPDYGLDNSVIGERSVGSRVWEREEEPAPPVVEVEGDVRRTAKVGEPMILAAVVTDDGPAPSLMQRFRDQETDYGLRADWYVYRRTGSVTFEPEQRIRPYPPGLAPPPLSEDGRSSAKVTFGEPGTYVLRVVAGRSIDLQVARDVTVTVLP